ncbi:MAG TPA: 50S ribosomal protein L29 [Candidatus Paceibacterota bacterium]|jgi:ribosomal protein L29|nr:50S ribosomal protein L29 [Candidatus Paceibacterota bacterium]HPT40037.1 50S ribosomal protein L29 [Candidatus Paceibacterota bacterium]
MDLKDLKKQTESELQSLLAQKQERLRVLRFDLSFGKVKNVREIRATRKIIAQIQTILKEWKTKK